MLRFTYVAFVLGAVLLVIPGVGQADQVLMGPTQALARINSSGQLELCVRVSKPVYETMQGTMMVKKVKDEQRVQKQTVTEDGVSKEVDVPVTVKVEVMVPETYTYTVGKMVYETAIQKFPASTNAFRREADKAELPLFDLAGYRLSVTAVENRLHDWTLVLISKSGKALDRRFASIFKPTTIVIGVPPQTAMAMPGYAPPQLMPQPAIPQPATLPPPAASRDVPSALSPVAFLADEATPNLPQSPEPTFAFAKVWGEKSLALRTEDEKTIAVTSMINREVDKVHEGKTVKVVVCEPRQFEKVIQTQETVRIPLSDVSATRAPNKEVSKSELPSLLAFESLAVVSSDGKPVDSLWQRNLRDGVFVIVAPPVPAGQACAAPAMMPVPAPVAVPQPVIPQPAPAPAPVAVPST